MGRGRRFRLSMAAAVVVIATGCGGGGGDSGGANQGPVQAANNPQACFTELTSPLAVGQTYQVQNCSTGLALTQAQVEATGLVYPDTLQFVYTGRRDSGGGCADGRNGLGPYSFTVCPFTVSAELRLCVLRYLPSNAGLAQEVLVGCQSRTYGVQ
jgi:hypothetical protein